MTDDARYAALLARDPRFDGVFFVGVSTTGIYCRPICPARTPGRTRVTFHATAVQAEAAGFRACFRCRPELAPGHAHHVEVDAIDALVAALARRINEGALSDASLDALAAELGVSARHLRRATESRLGVSPIELATSRRLGLAKQLLQDTRLPLAQVAFAAGFRSVRRFNAAFAERMGAPPSRLRRSHRTDAAGSLDELPTTGVTTIRLDYRPPYAWDEILAFLRVRAIPGVERVDLAGRGAYHRVVHFHDVGEEAAIPRGRAAKARGVTGTITVRPSPKRASLLLDVSPELVPHLLRVVARVRRQFDLDARPDAIAHVLGGDDLLGPRVKASPGMRVPGAFDPFEASIRALLGQQVSVAAATTLAGRFAAAFGAPLPGAPQLARDAKGRAFAQANGPLAVRFPTAAEVAKRSIDEIATLGLPGARAAAILAFATAVASGAVKLEGALALEPFVDALDELPGIGPWTAHYLAMRARHDPDAFPAADLGVMKALKMNAKETEARAEAWRPYRAYAVIHLWNSLGDTNGDRDEEDRKPTQARRGVRRSEPPDQRRDGRRDARDSVPARPRAAIRAGKRPGRSVLAHARGEVSAAERAAR
ncbi:MAG TPA: AlkA N-terminal domain-containing protein [Kofleriaceae bacterium]|jgi:AraC family transcriptional regulator of adaptative response / DNA-3-methyladenine glycosylase II